MSEEPGAMNEASNTQPDSPPLDEDPPHTEPIIQPDLVEMVAESSINEQVPGPATHPSQVHPISFRRRTLDAVRNLGIISLSQEDMESELRDFQDQFKQQLSQVLSTAFNNTHIQSYGS